MQLVSVRSFSALRRIKSYLRATMSQERLNHIMVLYFHKHLTDQICYIEICNEFSKGLAIVKPTLETFYQQTCSVLITGALCMLAAIANWTRILQPPPPPPPPHLFGIMLSLKTSCYLVRKKRWFLGRADGGACSAPPYPLAGREGCPPSPGDATILFRPLHFLFPSYATA